LFEEKYKFLIENINEKFEQVFENINQKIIPLNKDETSE